MLRVEVFPPPLGPMMARIYFGLAYPDRLWRICFIFGPPSPASTIRLELAIVSFIPLLYIEEFETMEFFVSIRGALAKLIVSD